MHGCSEKNALCFQCFTTQDISLKEALTQQPAHSPGIWFEFEHVNFSCLNTPCLYISGKRWELGASCQRTYEVILLHPNKNTLSSEWENRVLHCLEWIANIWQLKVKIYWHYQLCTLASLMCTPPLNSCSEIWQSVFNLISSVMDRKSVSLELLE